VTNDDSWAAPPTGPTGTTRTPLLWPLWLLLAALMLVAATGFGVLAHFRHPAMTLEGLIMAVCFAVIGAREALRAGVVRRQGWWQSRAAAAGLTVVSFAAAIAVFVLGLYQLFS
jgi:peptidoglycan/LPS O-acetylase OafA/YrhL